MSAEEEGTNKKKKKDKKKWSLSDKPASHAGLPGKVAFPTAAKTSHAENLMLSDHFGHPGKHILQYIRERKCMH